MGSDRVTFYLQERKPKASLIAERCLKSVPGDTVRCATELRPGWAMFYGVDQQTLPLYHQARKEGRALYVDNGYFCYGTYYRVTKNRLQHDGWGTPAWGRYRKLKLKWKKWRGGGNHVLITLQTAYFFDLFAEQSRTTWLEALVRHARKNTSMPIWIREKPHPQLARRADLAALAGVYEGVSVVDEDWPLEECLSRAHVCVSYSSRCAIDAMAAGVPAVVTDRDSAMARVTDPDLSGMSDRHRGIYQPRDRENWAAVLAGQQWTLGELAEGEWTRVMEG